MPYVNVKLVGSLSLDKTREIAGGISGILQEVAGKPPEVTYTSFEETTPNHWARGGESPVFKALSFPFVNVKAAGPLTYEQKEKIAGGITKLLSEFSVESVPPTYIVFEEIPRENWAVNERILGQQ